MDRSEITSVVVPEGYAEVVEVDDDYVLCRWTRPHITEYVTWAVNIDPLTGIAQPFAGRYFGDGASGLFDGARSLLARAGREG